ncbi:MAG: DUF4405 domain-containing protein [Candidatus Nanoarchaeia archaeon]|nr:DUF4405 domain-containing protein [Candidatus Nanoarchaeia archaeon]
MDRSKLNYWIDISCLVSGVIMIITGVLKLIKFHSANLNLLHDLTGIIFTILVLIHLTLHFKWIKENTKKLLH